MMHLAVLLRNQVIELQIANEAATQCKSHKRKRLQKDRKLIFEESVCLIALKKIGAFCDGKKVKKMAGVEGSSQPQRCCGWHGKTGHNTCTCA